MKSRFTITDNQRAEIIALFLGMEDNSYKNISLISGYSKQRVSKVIDEYYKKKSKRFFIKE